MLQTLLKHRQGSLWKIILILTFLALFFQLVHFGEHIAQALAWLGGYREAPYMTALGHYLMNVFGTFFYPDASQARQMQMGNEILHLIGNTLYAFGTLALLFFIRTRMAVTAAVIETFHLYEHISLTLSAAYLGTAIGMSTWFGLPMEHTSLVTLRVWWHFVMNAVPTTLSILVLWRVYKPKK